MARKVLTHNPKLTGERMNEVNEASPAAIAAMLSELLCVIAGISAMYAVGL